MVNKTDLVQQLNKACNDKDIDKALTFLHPDYRMKDPTMSLNGPAEFKEFMQNCPFDGKFEPSMIYEDGNVVIQVGDCKMTKPEKYTLRICDIVTFKDDKIFSEEVIYDTADLPESAKKAA